MTITERIDAVTGIPAKFLGEVIPAPKAVKIELTGKCNFRCQYCSLRTRTAQPTTDMDFGFFQRITQEMLDAGVEEIGVFYLGESFSNPALLVDAIAHCKNIGFGYVFLTTNGSLATPQWLEAVMAAGLDSLKFSMNNADAEQFAAMAAVKPKLFHKAVANLKEARRIRDQGKYDCGLYASSILYDGSQRARMEEFLAEHVVPWVDEHYFLPLYGQMTQQTQERIDELGFTPTAGNQGRIGALRDPLPCWAVLSEGHVTSDGLLSACCFDADGRFAMADLNEVSFMEGWNSETFQKLRAAHLKKDVTGTICEGCTAYA